MFPYSRTMREIEVSDYNPGKLLSKHSYISILGSYIKQGRMKRHKAATVFIWDI